jgi:ADP-ribosylglycohydrolase
MLEKIKAVVIGHAVADALGVPVEFASREELDGAPVTEMEGYGTYPVPAGAWSDDTSMSLCTMSALADDGLNYDLVMQNFVKWYDKGEFTPTGVTFDVGNTCSIAIENYVNNQKPYTMCGMNGERDNGNGSLMRIHPVVLYLADKQMSVEEKIQIVHTMSALTHAHDRSKIGCGIYAFILWELLKNPTMYAVKDGLDKANAFYQGQTELFAYNRLFETGFIATPKKQIKSSGYIVDSLEAAVWCILTTNSYERAVLKAVNLGEDTDTVGAITGSLAGALYGYDAIPSSWKNALLKLSYIEELCERFSAK